jgi:hypothetical protein
LQEYLATREKERNVYNKIMLKMDAVHQLVQFLFVDIRTIQANKNKIYTQFFKSPAVVQYCDRNGIDPPTDEAARHRVPFLLNILESMGVICSDRSNVYIEKLLLCNAVVRVDDSETAENLNRRKVSIVKNQLEDDEVISKLRERLGKDFYSSNYHIKNYELVLED